MNQKQLDASKEEAKEMGYRSGLTFAIPNKGLDHEEISTDFWDLYPQHAELGYYTEPHLRESVETNEEFEEIFYEFRDGVSEGIDKGME